MKNNRRSQVNPQSLDSDLYYYLSSKVQEKYYSFSFNEQAHSFKKPKVKKAALSSYLGKKNSKVALKPDFKILESKNLESALLDRESTYRFKSKALSFAHVSTAISSVFGARLQSKSKMSRPFPSAGGLYPLELYFLALNIEGLQPGLYLVSPESNSLLLLRNGPEVFQLKKFWAQSSHFKNPAGLFFVTSIFEKSRAKYGLRALRFILMEAGTVGMAFNLVCNQLNIGFCFDGGGYDGKIENLLGLDGLQQGFITTFVIGSK